MTQKNECCEKCKPTTIEDINYPDMEIPISKPICVDDNCPCHTAKKVEIPEVIKRALENGDAVHATTTDTSENWRERFFANKNAKWIKELTDKTSYGWLLAFIEKELERAREENGAFAAGRSEGFFDGFEKGQAADKTTYMEAYEIGNQAGLVEGGKLGFKAGRKVGREEGRQEADWMGESLKGAYATGRAANLTPERRKEIATIASNAFRAWDNLTNEMTDAAEHLTDYLADARYSVMQFTGLKDKNGEIYEGDIVRVLGMDWIVTWYGGAGAWWVNGIYDGFGKMTLSEALQKGGEVIGNMYENERSAK